MSNANSIDPADPPIVLALRPRQCAAAIGLGVRKLFDLTKAEAIPHLHIGTAVLYPVRELQDWLTAQAAPGKTEVLE